MKGLISTIITVFHSLEGEKKEKKGEKKEKNKGGGNKVGWTKRGFSLLQLTDLIIDTIPSFNCNYWYHSQLQLLTVVVTIILEKAVHICKLNNFNFCLLNLTIFPTVITINLHETQSNTVHKRLHPPPVETLHSFTKNTFYSPVSIRKFIDIINLVNESCVQCKWHVHINMEVVNSSEICVLLLYKFYEPTASQIYWEWNSFTGWYSLPKCLLTMIACSDIHGPEGTVRNTSYM